MGTFGFILHVPDEVLKFMYSEFGWNVRSFVFIYVFVLRNLLDFRKSKFDKDCRKLRT